MFQEPTEDIKKLGEDQATGLLAHLSDSDPVDIYKAICSIKCAEILTRAFDTPAYPSVVEIVATFVETTMKLVDGNAGNRTNGMAVLSLVEFIAPFKSSPTPDAFAIRMHMFDTMILESAKKLKIEAAAKSAIDTLSRDILMFLLKTTGTPAPGNTEIN